MKAHPVINGRPLQLGDHVRLKPGHHVRAGEVTGIRVRCWGKPGDDTRWIGRDEHGQDRYRVDPWEQVWIELNGESGVYSTDDIAEVLA